MADPNRIHVYIPGYAEAAAERLKAAFPDTEIVALVDETAFVAALADMEILVGWRTPRGHWAAAKQLQLIQLSSAGVDKLLPAPDLDPSVAVCNAAGAHEPHMPEFVWAMLLALAYRVPRNVHQQQQHRWKTVVPQTLAGKRLCVVGLGTIGTSVARRAAGFGMEVVGIRRTAEPVEGVSLVVTPQDRLTALADAVATVVVTPLTDETRGLIGEAEIGAMATRSMLVDVSRGGVVDHDAVVAALRSKHLWGAALDVFPTEPLPNDSPLWDEENLLVTSHTAGNSPAYFDQIISVLRRNLAAIEQGRQPPTLVDRSRGY